MIDSNDGGVDVSINGGETWYAPPLPIAPVLPRRAPTTACPTTSPAPCRTSARLGAEQQPDDGGIALCDWHGVGGGETGFTAPDPTDPNIVYAGEYGGYISRYDHRTRQARNVSVYPYNPSGHGAEDLQLPLPVDRPDR